MQGSTRLLVVAGLVMTGCTAPIAMRDINAMRPNCAHIDKQIALLGREKAENNQRLLARV